MAYDVTFRKRVLQYLNEGNSIKKTSSLFRVSDKTILKWKKMQAAGSLKDPVRKRNFRKIDPLKLDAYVHEHPDAYLLEIAEHFQCASSSVWEALDKLDLTRKKKSKRYREQDKKK